MTDKSTSHRWNTETIASSRAKREASSAPNKREMAIYERFFKKAITSKKNPRVLVLGATPEMRDLSLKYDCYTLSVDISWQILVAMHEVMRHSQHTKNKVLLSNWLELDKIIKSYSFDVVLADVSLCNLAPGDNPKMLNILRKLLKKDGYFITRQAVIPVHLIDKDYHFFQQAYDKRQIDWFTFIWTFVLSHHSEIKISPYQLDIGKMCLVLQPLLNQGKVKFRPEDQWKIENALQHINKVIHTEFPEKEFEDMLGKNFVLLEKDYASTNKKITFAPIYFLRII